MAGTQAAVDYTKVLVKNTVRFILLVLFLISLVVSLLLCMLADIFQAYAPVFPLWPMVFASVALNVACAVSTSLYHRVTCKASRSYKSSGNNHAYLAMQGFGYGLLFICPAVLFLYIELLASPVAVYRYGLITALGGSCAVANGLLIASLRYSEKTQRRVKEGGLGGGERPQRDSGLWRRRLLLLPDGETAIVVLLCIIALTCSIIAEYFTHLRRALTIVGMLLLVVSAAITRVGTGYRSATGEHPFSISRCSFRTGIVQGLGWFLGGATLCFDLVLCNSGAGAPPSWHIISGLSSMVSVAALLFARFHRFTEPTFKQGLQLSSDGPYVMTATSLFQLTFVWCLTLLLSTEYCELGMQLRQGLITCQTLTAVSMFALPLCTHFLGRVVFGKEYGIWISLDCRLEFAILQRLAWFCYSIAIFFAVLHMTESNHFRFVVIQALLVGVSQCLVHASLWAFGGGTLGRYSSDVEDQESLSRTTSTKSTAQEEDSEGEASVSYEGGGSALPLVLNAEMVTAIAVCVCGIALRLVADVESMDGAFVGALLGVPRKSLLNLARVMATVAVPLAHISSRDRVPLWQPFVGCGGYVSMQAVGWSVYAINTLIEAANYFHEERRSLASPVFGTQSMPLEHTVDGVCATVPFICIFLGSLFETWAQQSEKIHQRKMQQKIVELNSLLQHVIADPEDRERTKSLLKFVIGPRWKDLRSSGSSDEDERAEEVETRKEGMRNIVAILCVCVMMLFATSAFSATHQPAFTLIFGISGMMMTSVSCFSLQLFYGSIVHGATGTYSYFMPFSGGQKFVAFQTAGWSCYAAALLLILISCLEGRGSPTAFVCMGFFSVAAQFLILNSIPHFDSTPRPASLLEQNAEAALAVFALVGSFTFGVVWNAYTGGGIPGQAPSPLPIIVTAIAASCAAPLGIVSLKRHMERSAMFAVADGLESSSEASDGEEEIRSDGHTDAIAHVSNGSGHQFPSSLIQGQVNTGVDSERGTNDSFDTQTSRSFPGSTGSFGSGKRCRSVQHMEVIPGTLYTICLILALLATLIWVIFVPIVLFYMFYSYAYSGLAVFHMTFTTFHIVLFLLSIAVVTPVLVQIIYDRRCKGLRGKFWSPLVAFTVYSLPTIVVSTVLVVWTQVDTMGAEVFALNMVFMSCLSFLSYAYLVASLFNTCFLGYVLHFYLYTCLVQGLAPLVVWKCVTDVGFTVFWLWYLRGYGKLPHITGCMCGAKSRDLFRTYLSPAIVDYFSARLIVDGRGKAGRGKTVIYSNSEGEEENAGPDHNDPSNKYIYSFHPHGVFPGTALWLPMSPQWEELIGRNEETIVTTHGADVIFAVPFMRDALMSVGTMSVSRKGIENCLKQNNSPIIVTGGMAEMVYQKGSDTEMHIVMHHSGFVRMALQHGVPIVPILCFAEQNVMMNVPFPRLQRLTSRKLGFPFPTMPYGRWFLPLPHARPLTVVVGKPILPDPAMCNADDPDHVVHYRLRYFGELQRLFFKYRDEAGYPNMVLHLHCHNETHIVTEFKGSESVKDDQNQ